MYTGDLGDFFSLSELPQDLRNQLLFFSAEQESSFLKRCRYGFEEAYQSLGLQDRDEIQWVVSPSIYSLKDSKLPALPSDSYGFGFFRPRYDKEVVFYLNGHDQPLHSPNLPPGGNPDYFGDPQGLVWGLQAYALDLGYEGGGFDGYVEVPQIFGNPFVPEQTLVALGLYAYFSRETSSRIEKRGIDKLGSYYGVPISFRALQTGLSGLKGGPSFGVWIPQGLENLDIGSFFSLSLEGSLTPGRVLVPPSPIPRDEVHLLVDSMQSRGITAQGFLVPENGTISLSF